MKRVLIVDDERSIRKLLSQYLVNAGYTCWVAQNVQEAKNVLNNMPIDMVLTDINMPGESGIDLARYVKIEFPDLPVVIVSIIDNPIAAKEVLELDVYGYIVKPFTRNLVLITVDNAFRRGSLELQSKSYQQELESKVRQQTSRIQASEEKYCQIVDNIGIGVAVLTAQMEIIQMNPQMRSWFSHVEPNKGIICYQSFQNPPRDSPCEDCPVVKTFAEGKSFDATIRLEGEQKDRYFRDHSSPIYDENGDITATILLVEEVTEQLTLEQELRQAQKLEAIGQLAAGIAHEINTPIQYVGDNTEFLQESFEDVNQAFSAYEELLQAAKAQTVTAAMLDRVDKHIGKADISYLKEEIPRAIEQSLEGVKRITGIVHAMRDFSHPGSNQKTKVNLNHAIENTVIVSRNEWKYVAEMELDLETSLPEVPCLPGEINQVLLNIVVNAAHAITEMMAHNRPTNGKISISTHKMTDSVAIHISDTGAGIPGAVQHRIFDPFFTTKDVGKGTGQGLAIAHSVITDKHGGSLRFETKEKEGTTFIIELPLASEEQGIFRED